MTEGLEPTPRDGARSGRATARRVATGALANAGGQIVTMGVWFALTPLILTKLGPTQYGLWVLVSAFTAYGMLLDFGVGPAVTKYVAEYRARDEPDEASSVIATAFRLYCGLGLGALLLSIPCALLVAETINVPDGEQTTLLWLVVLTGAAIAVELPATTAYATLQGLQRFDLVNLISAAAMLTLGVATLLILLLGGGVLEMVAINVPLTLLWQIPAIALVRRIAPEITFGWRGARKDLVRRVARFSASLAIFHASWLVKKKTDEIVISAVLPVAQLTPYALARRLSDVPELLTYQFTQVLMPLASDLDARDDRERLRSLSIVSTRLALAIFIPVGGALAVLADPLLHAWVDASYAGGAEIVLILVAAGLFEIAVWPAASVLQGTSRHRPLAVIAVGSAVLNLALSVVLIHTSGVTGVALATLFATAAEMLVVVLYVLAISDVRVGTVALHAVLPAVAPAIPVLLALVGIRALTDPSSLLQVALLAAAGAVAYVLAYLAYPTNAQERRVILDLGQRARRRKRAPTG